MTAKQDRDHIIDRICFLAGDQVGVEREQVSLETRFEADLEYDSLDKVEFTMTVEDEFDIDFPDEAIADVASIGQVVDLLMPLLEHQETVSAQ